MGYKEDFELLRRTPKQPDDIQAMHDAFYRENGPCCAGCDHWRWNNSRNGECTKAAPVAERDRFGSLGWSSASIIVGAGHPFTKRDHKCGDFIDTFD